MAQEKQFEGKMKRFLELKGIYPLGTEKQKVIDPIGYYTKRWGGGIYVKSGLPDYQIVVNGVCLEVETKAQNGKPSALQIQKLKQIDDAGGFGILLYPDEFEIFKDLIECLSSEWTPLTIEAINDLYGQLKERWCES